MAARIVRKGLQIEDSLLDRYAVVLPLGSGKRKGGGGGTASLVFTRLLAPPASNKPGKGIPVPTKILEEGK